MIWESVPAEEGSAAATGIAACELRRIRQRIKAVIRFARVFPIEKVVLFF